MSKNILEIKELLEKHFKRSKNSIVSIGIRRKEDSIKYYQNNGKNKDVEFFGIGSISKTIISTYLCILVKENKINLENRVNDYFDLNPKIKYPTLFELSTHTSGYHAFIPFISSIKILITKGFNKRNIYSNLDKEWLTNSLMRIKPLKKRKYRYSDYNYAVLAIIIEKVMKKPFKEVILDFMHQEIGMKNTYYGDYEKTKNSKYSWIWNDDNPFLPSGGLFSTIDDMLKFLDYQIINKNDLLLAHGSHHRTNINKSVYTGFSWNSFHNGSFYWHIGGQGYYRSYALFDLKRDISIVILSTVDINIQHVGRLGSSVYRNVKRNYNITTDFLKSYGGMDE